MFMMSNISPRSIEHLITKKDNREDFGYEEKKNQTR